MGSATVLDVTDDPTVHLLQELIRNRCVNDGTPESGHEERSVRTLADYLGTEGEVFEPAPGRQSVVYRVPGTDPNAPSLVLLPHLDVVPVNPDGWSVDRSLPRSPTGSCGAGAPSTCSTSPRRWPPCSART